MPVIMLVVLRMVMHEQHNSLHLYMQAKIMLVNQHGACERASICEEVEKFQLFWC